MYETENISKKKKCDNDYQEVLSHLSQLALSIAANRISKRSQIAGTEDHHG